jgi:hypothetical protein
MQTFLWNEACEKVFVTASVVNGKVVYDTSGLTEGVYFISVKYKPNSIQGFALSPPYPTVNYRFGTFKFGSLLPTTGASVDFMPKN